MQENLFLIKIPNIFIINTKKKIFVINKFHFKEVPYQVFVVNLLTIISKFPWFWGRRIP